MSGNTITGAAANTGSYQRWQVGYTVCEKIDIENVVATPGETVYYSDLDIVLNGGSSTPTNATSTSVYDVSANPASAVSFGTSGMSISPTFTGSEITVTFGRKDTTATAVFSVFVDNFIGEFYLTNLATDTVMCYDYTDNSNSIRTRIYSNQLHDCQKWIVERVDTTPYYTIRSSYNGYYLALPENTNYDPEEGVYAKLYSGTIPETAQWKMYYDDLGDLRILPRNSWDVCIDTNGNSNGSTLKLAERSDLSSQLWNRFSVNAEKVVYNEDPNVNIEYNREAAATYAKQYATVKNTAYTDYSNSGGDCTNYVSQCVHAGNMDFVGAPTSKFESTTVREHNYQNWFYTDFDSDNDVSFTWTSAEIFRQHWGWSPTNSNMRAYAYIQYDSIDQLVADKEYLLSIIQPGDIIQQVNENDETEAGHSMFVYAVTDKNIYFSQHTYEGPSIPYDGGFIETEDIVIDDEAVKMSLFGENTDYPENAGIATRYKSATFDMAFILISRGDTH